MKEALMYGIGDLRVVESPIPEFKDDEMLVKVHACGICPTDIRKYRVGNHGVAKLPMNLGHEWAGDVVQVGSRVKQFKPGMRVASNGYAGYAEYAVVAPRFIPFSQELPDNVTLRRRYFRRAVG